MSRRHAEIFRIREANFAAQPLAFEALLMACDRHANLMNMRRALIVVDMQNAFYSLDVCRDSFARSIPVINEAIEKFRSASWPIIFTRTSEALKVECLNGFELISELMAHTEDKIVDKDFPNAFWNTDLEIHLKSQNISSVVICGCFSMACVFLSHHGALERGIDSYTLVDGAISSDRTAIELLENMTAHLHHRDL